MYFGIDSQCYATVKGNSRQAQLKYKESTENVSLWHIYIAK